MKKKLVCILVFLVIMSSMVTANAQSLSKENIGVGSTINTVIKPNFLYTNTTSTSISFGTGTATATGSITGYPGITTKVMIAVYVQKLVSGTWSMVGYNSQVFDNTYYATLQKTCNITSGYYYRTKAVYTAFSGTDYEQITEYSSQAWY